ncbi:oligosaccharide flippase family protein [Anaeromyxobacter sp. PSR-1]|uniref:oligosaccharide flippase family protein n=1 Tax=Anaeromyxobacter sp. PSR-1 TaxID=1300915 RepID=UPI0005E684FB|nr:oligosaccharide flippase family protein [Anaeromyxobacter sp. PSR-1]GAO03334.1 amylovoran biosynthesis protein AmsL [Anaeromyxobacter sp. PSR-1]
MRNVQPADAPRPQAPEDETPAPAAEHLGRRVARGSVWVAAGYGAAQIIRFGANLVLARLLFPRAFGLMLLVNVCLQGLQLFSDVGIGASIIQHRRSDTAFVNTAWTVQVVRGFLLWLATFAVAWPAAQLYGEPQLMWMLPVAGLAACMDGFVSTAIHTANRDLRMARLQVLDLVVQASASAIMIAGAWLTRSVWALLAGMIAASVIRTVLSHVALGGARNRFQWERDAAASLLHFGKWVFVSSVVTFLAQQGDRLVFGKMLPLERLGVYNIALSLVDAPTALISAISFRVFFPLFSEMRRTGPDVETAYRRASSSMALLAGAGALALVLAGPLAVQLLYDDRYAEASWIVRLLALGIWGSSLVHFTASVVLAGGRVKWLAAANAARLVWLLGAVPLAFRQWGFEVAIVCVVLADLPRYLFLGLGCRKDGLHIFAGDAWRSLKLGAAAVAGLLVLELLGARSVPAVGAACVVGLAVWLAGNREPARWYLDKVRNALAARRG